MATARTIPVRLSKEILGHLDAYAERLGIKRSEAIRICLAYQFGLVPSVDPKALRTLDGRTYRYTQRSGAPTSSGDMVLAQGRNSTASMKKGISPKTLRLVQKKLKLL
jgi:hypothetical protein